MTSTPIAFDAPPPAGIPLLRRFAIIWLLGMLLLSGILWAFYRVQADSGMALVSAREWEALQLALQTSRTEFSNIRSDLLYLTDQYALLDDGGARTSVYASLATRYAAFASRKRIYDRIACFDEHGDEVVRVDWNDGRPQRALVSPSTVGPDATLVRQALSLAPGEVSVSAITLRSEHGRVVQPPRPIIRFATPIADATGRRRGALVLEYRADNFLKPLQDIGQVTRPGGHLWLIDRQGYWLLGPRAEEEWGFAFPTRAARRFSEHDADAWAALQRMPQGGQMRTREGLYAYGPVSPDPTTARSGAPWWVVVHHPRGVLAAQNAPLRERLRTVAAALALILAGAAWAMAYYSLRRRAAEASVRASEMRFRALLESAPDGIIIVDRAGRIVLANVQAEKQFGYARKEILDQPVEMLVPAALRDVHVHHREGYDQNPYTRPMGAGLELYGERKDGSTFPLEISLSPLDMHEGRVVTAIIRDISARKLAERQREEAQARYRQLMDNLPVGVFRKTPGPDGRFLEVNPALVSMLEADSPAALLSPPVGAFQTASGQPLFTDEEASSGAVLSEEVELRTVTGRPFWAAITARLRRDDHGQGYYDGIVEDVTKRKEIERELRRRSIELEATNQELEAFSYSVSHDLRAPLRAIDGFSRILITDHAGQLDDIGRDRLERVRRAAQNMGTLIDDLLKLSRVTRTELKREAIDLSALAAEVVDELRRQAPERQAEVTIESGLHAQGDRGLLRIVLANLLGNAWKFTGGVSEARIEFASVAEGNVPTFVVRDNGAGFDMAYAGKLFGVFQRLHDTSQFPGTGIGLATVQRIIHKHGGRIWAESEVGRGARFYFTLEPEVAT